MRVSDLVRIVLVLGLATNRRVVAWELAIKLHGDVAHGMLCNAHAVVLVLGLTTDRREVTRELVIERMGDEAHGVLCNAHAIVVVPDLATDSLEVAWELISELTGDGAHGAARGETICTWLGSRLERTSTFNFSFLVLLPGGLMMAADHISSPLTSSLNSGTPHVPSGSAITPALHPQELFSVNNAKKAGAAMVHVSLGT